MPDQVYLGAVDPNQSFSSLFADRLMSYMPEFYHDSVFLKDYFKALAVEFDIFDILLQDYNVKEIDRIIANTDGWGFEKLVAQKFSITSNHFLQKWADLGGIPDRSPVDHWKTKEMLKVVMKRGETITPNDLKNLIILLTDIALTDIDIVEDFANYKVQVSIRFPTDSNLIPFMTEKINKTLPAHLVREIAFYAMRLDDSPPGELGDAPAVLLS